jgi:uncharacterized Rmd1/YagE family protein
MDSLTQSGASPPAAAPAGGGTAPTPISAPGPGSSSLSTGARVFTSDALVPLRAYAFATTFRLRELAGVFQCGEVRLDKDCLVIQLPAASGAPQMPRLAVLFDFGAVVLIGLSADEREPIIRAISSRLSPEPHPPLTEDFLVELRPSAPIQVKFDRVVLHEPGLPALKLVSLLLAQSVAMDYYDEDVQEILRRTEAITASLRSAGHLPGRVDALVKFIGSCIETKNGVIATLALFDKPEATWEDPDLDSLYNRLREELELDDRFRALEAKLRMIQETLVLLVDLSQSRSTRRLEITVVLLILFEVLLMLWQMFRGSGHA